MRTLSILTILVIGLINLSCDSKSQNPVDSGVKLNTSIQGELNDFPSGQLLFFYKLDQQGMAKPDTLKVDGNGKFSHSFNLAETGFYRLQLGQNNFTNLIISPNDAIKLTGSAISLERKTTVEGSIETANLRELNQSLFGYFKSLDSLQRMAQQYQQQGNAMGYSSAVVALRSLDAVKSNIAVEFITKHPEAFASIAAAENLNPEKDTETMKLLADGLSKNYGQNSIAKEIITRTENALKLSLGAEAPEIALENPQGQLTKLSELRGKVVLIDFWASWCKPCRMENPNVKKMYDKYKNKGFEIYGVSLDKTKDAWIQAIAQDNLPWVHVSDLGFWNSSVVPIYNVQSIPKTILLDKEGKIIAKDLRGPSLEAKLAELFGA